MAEKRRLKMAFNQVVGGSNPPSLRTGKTLENDGKTSLSRVFSCPEAAGKDCAEIQIYTFEHI